MGWFKDPSFAGITGRRVYEFSFVEFWTIGLIMFNSITKLKSVRRK
jgi:hypothetical protein